MCVCVCMHVISAETNFALSVMCYYTMSLCVSSDSVSVDSQRTLTSRLESLGFAGRRGAPVTVDDVCAGLLPQAFQVFEPSMSVVLKLVISTLQDIFCCYQCHVHLHAPFML